MTNERSLINRFCLPCQRRLHWNSAIEATTGGKTMRESQYFSMMVLLLLLLNTQHQQQAAQWIGITLKCPIQFRGKSSKQKHPSRLLFIHAQSTQAKREQSSMGVRLNRACNHSIQVGLLNGGRERGRMMKRSEVEMEHRKTDSINRLLDWWVHGRWDGRKIK